jgi:hypothetical protein
MEYFLYEMLYTLIYESHERVEGLRKSSVTLAVLYLVQLGILTIFRCPYWYYRIRLNATYSNIKWLPTDPFSTHPNVGYVVFIPRLGWLT